MDDDTILKYLRDSLGPAPDLSQRAASRSLRPPGFGPGLRGAREELPPEPPFEAVDVIGRGGMGEVVRAHQKSLDRHVALKRLLRLHRGDAEAERLFLAEALITGRLEHPNIVPVHELGATPQGELFLAMKLVEGRSWQEVLDTGSRDLVFHLGVLQQVCHAVAFAHSRGIVHNDLKPANVMLGSFGEVLVMDWGLAVELDSDAPGVRGRAAIRGLCGTPAYAPPELLRGDGEAIGPHSDVYLLGGLLHAILTGRPPHAGEDLVGTVRAALDGARPVLDATAPAELRALCREALDPDPRGRPASAEAFRARLDAFLAHRESRLLAGVARERLRASEALLPGSPGSDGERQPVHAGFAEAIAGFGQALALWPENAAAAEELRAARRAWARAALTLGDIGLAEAQLAELEADAADVAELRGAVAVARARRTAEAQARRRLRWVTLGAVLAALIGLGTGFAVVSAKNREIEARNVDLEREQRRVLEQNEQIAAQNAAILAEQRRVEQQRAYARRRGDIASEALEALATRVQEQLLHGLGDRRSHRMAGEILRVALDGWEALRDAALEEEAVSRGRALAQLQVGLLYLEVRGDAAAALRELSAADSVLVALASAEEEPSAERDGPPRAAAVATLEQDRARVRLALGEVWKSLGRLPEARRAFASALELLDGGDGSARGSHLRALCRASLADAIAEQGQLRAAARAYEQAIRELERGAAPGDAAATRLLAPCLAAAGALHHRLGETGLALSFYRRATELLAADASDSAAWLRAQASALGGLGLVLSETGQLEEARRQAEAGLGLARRLHALDPGSFAAREALIGSLHTRAVIAEQQGESSPARALMAEAVALRQALTKEDPRNLRQLEGLGRALGELSGWLVAHGSRAEAESLLVAAVACGRRLVGADSSNLVQRRLLGALLQDRAQLAVDARRWEDAEAAAGEALAIHRGLVRLDPDDVTSQRKLCRGLHTAARLEQVRGDLEACRRLLKELLDRLRDLLAREPDNSENARGLALALVQSARMLIELGAPDAAQPAAEEARARLEQLVAADPTDVALLEQLGDALRSAGTIALQKLRLDDALDRFAAADEVLTASLAAGEPRPALLLDLASVRFGRAGVHIRQGALDAAEASTQEGLELVGVVLAADAGAADAHRLRAQLLGLRGEIAFERGTPRAAEASFRAQLEAARKLVRGVPASQDLRVLWTALSNLAGQLEAMGDPEAALPLAEEALELARLHVARDAANLLSRRELLLSLKLLNLLELETEALDAAAQSGDAIVSLYAELRARFPEDGLHEAHGLLCLVQVALTREACGEPERALELCELAAERLPAVRARAPDLAASLAPIPAIRDSYRRCLALGEGTLAPESPADYEALAGLRFAEGRWAEAVDAYRGALADGVISDPELVLNAARAAARAAAEAEPGDASELRRAALRWLGYFLGYQERAEEVLSARPDARADSWTAVRLARIPEQRRRAHDHPDFAELRGDPEFEALFAPDAPR